MLFWFLGIAISIRVYITAHISNFTMRLVTISAIYNIMWLLKQKLKMPRLNTNGIVLYL